MAEARVLYGSQGGLLLYGGGLWRPGILSLIQLALEFPFRMESDNVNGSRISTPLNSSRISTPLNRLH